MPTITTLAPNCSTHTSAAKVDFYAFLCIGRHAKQAKFQAKISSIFLHGEGIFAILEVAFETDNLTNWELIKLRNPNGYGSVVKLSGNRRRPYRVRKTIGFNGKGHPIYQVLDYTKTREEGMILLAAYNKNPWNVDEANTTFADLFDLWLERKAPKTTISTAKMMKTAYTHCKLCYHMKYAEIKAYHMQETIDDCGSGYGAQHHIKTFWRHMDKFALELDITSRNYSVLLTTAPKTESQRTPFTDDEVNTVWAMEGQSWVDSVLFMLYTGFRISEMLDMRKENVDLEASTFKGGTKTAAGKNRIVPIHPRIRSIVKTRMQEDGEYLFSYKGNRCGGTTYRVFWREVMEAAKIEHTPHECRHTFRSRLDSAGANKRCIDLMMGHKSGDVGERVYTHKTLDELRAAIELMT